MRIMKLAALALLLGAATAQAATVTLPSMTASLGAQLTGTEAHNTIDYTSATEATGTLASSITEHLSAVGWATYAMDRGVWRSGVTLRGAAYESPGLNAAIGVGYQWWRQSNEFIGEVDLAKPFGSHFLGVAQGAYGLRYEDFRASLGLRWVFKKAGKS